MIEFFLVTHSAYVLGKDLRTGNILRRAVVPLPEERQYRAGGSTAPKLGGSTGAAVVPGGFPPVVPRSQ